MASMRVEEERTVAGRVAELMSRYPPTRIIDHSVVWLRGRENLRKALNRESNHALNSPNPKTPPTGLLKPSTASRSLCDRRSTIRIVFQLSTGATSNFSHLCL
jgi:hypothetical protein